MFKLFLQPSRSSNGLLSVLYMVCVSTFAAASGGGVTRCERVARSASFGHAPFAVASGIATGVLRVLRRLASQQSYFMMPPKFQPPLYNHRLSQEGCAADIQYGIRRSESWLIGYSEDEVWHHIMAP